MVDAAYSLPIFLRLIPLAEKILSFALRPAFSAGELGITDEIFTYFGSRYAEKANKTADFSFGDEAFFTEFDEFYDLVDGKDQKISYEDFIAPVFILNAIESAVESGKEQPVRRVTL